jgi:hypothetical protein
MPFADDLAVAVGLVGVVVAAAAVGLMGVVLGVAGSPFRRSLGGALFGVRSAADLVLGGAEAAAETGDLRSGVLGGAEPSDLIPFAPLCWRSEDSDCDDDPDAEDGFRSSFVGLRLWPGLGPVPFDVDTEGEGIAPFPLVWGGSRPSCTPPLIRVEDS